MQRNTVSFLLGSHSLVPLSLHPLFRGRLVLSQKVIPNHRTRENALRGPPRYCLWSPYSCSFDFEASPLIVNTDLHILISGIISHKGILSITAKHQRIKHLPSRIAQSRRYSLNFIVYLPWLCIPPPVDLTYRLARFFSFSLTSSSVIS